MLRDLYGWIMVRLRFVQLIPAVVVEVWKVQLTWGSSAHESSFCDRRIAKLIQEKARRRKCKYMRLLSLAAWDMYRIQMQREQAGHARYVPVKGGK